MKLDKYLQRLHEQREAYAANYNMYRRYGVVALLSMSPHSLYTYIFMVLKKRCTKSCKKFQVKPECWYRCYLRSIGSVIRLISRDMGRLSKIENKSKRNRLRMRLVTQTERWEEKEDKVREKIRRIS